MKLLSYTELQVGMVVRITCRMKIGTESWLARIDWVDAPHVKRGVNCTYFGWTPVEPTADMCAFGTSNHYETPQQWGVQSVEFIRMATPTVAIAGYDIL